MIAAFHKMIELRRSVRRFKPGHVDSEILKNLLDAARLAPSAANKQALVLIAVNDPIIAAKIFETEKFAAYLGGAGQPGPGEEPTAHILIARNKELAIAETVRDVGAAAQTILMGACAYGLGATWLRSFDRPETARILGLSDQYEPDSVIALGLPGESPQVVPMKEGDVKYWRDETGQHFVPKRAFDEVCFLNGYGKGW
ncbi:MAG TPA: nitroreductase family protein [Desulfobacteria bacterium]|nr:nitroreductase family protein [Desulfobacteria bacterium]